MDSLNDLDQLRVEMKAAVDASVDAANKCQTDKVLFAALFEAYVVKVEHLIATTD
jgi:hypothetical protein